MSDFDDIEPADVFDVDDTIAPEQVAHRLHDLRVGVEQLVGGDRVPFWELDDDEQQIAYAIGEAFVDYFVDHRFGSLDDLAEHVHATRRHLARQRGDHSIPAWDDLGDDRRDLAIAIAREIVEWLRREGPR